MYRKYLPKKWSNPVNPLYRVSRPLKELRDLSLARPSHSPPIATNEELHCRPPRIIAAAKDAPEGSEHPSRAQPAGTAYDAVVPKLRGA